MQRSVSRNDAFFRKGPRKKERDPIYDTTFSTVSRSKIPSLFCLFFASFALFFFLLSLFDSAAPGERAEREQRERTRSPSFLVFSPIKSYLTAGRLRAKT